MILLLWGTWLFLIGSVILSIIYMLQSQKRMLILSCILLMFLSSVLTIFYIPKELWWLPWLAIFICIVSICLIIEYF